MQLKEETTSIFTKIKGKIHDLSVKIKQFICKNDVELTMVTGLFFILLATYKVNYIAFLYVLGFIFIVFSVFLLKFPQRRR